MPLYEYNCAKCDFRFELLRPVSQCGEEALCPRCQHKAERVMSTFASFAKDDGGTTTPIGASSCASCSAASCDSCHL